MRFTPLDMARIMNSAQTQNSTGPIDQPKSSTNESRVEAGVWFMELGNWSESTANAMPTISCPAIFALARRPSERCLTILM